jgi:hypothetical protein
MIHTISVLTLCITVWLVGCAASQPIVPNPIGKALLGKSKQELVSCAGNPLEETKTAEGTVLTYYKEAPIFEESFYSSKGSVSRAHHGCWAHLLMGDDRYGSLRGDFSYLCSIKTVSSILRHMVEISG